MKFCFGHINEGVMKFNSLGIYAATCWKKIPLFYLGVRLHEFVIMPNHIHGIIELVKSLDRTISHDPPDPRAQICAPTIGRIVRGFKAAVSKYAGYTVWQRNYYEHVIRSDNELRFIAHYIEYNPLQWDKDKYKK